MTSEARHAGDRLAHVDALDGLRGVAVAAVVVYHLWPGVLPGGFIGVDVFMVLSGFLLSSLLIQEAARTGRTSFASFLLARFRRLLPALLLVLMAVSAYAALAMPAIEAGRVRQHTIAALAYVANWRFVVDGTTYTDIVAGASPLRHLWSLSIEEQFYVVLALAVVLLVIVNRGPVERGDVQRLRWSLGAGAAALGVASAAWMVVLHQSGAQQARLYFGTDTRAQTLLVGVVLGAALVGRAPVGRAVAPARLAAGSGAAVLVGMALVARESAEWMYLGGFSVVAVAGAGVIGGVQVSGLRRLLERRPLVALGVISYGVYLWHWPIIVLATPERTGVSGPMLAVAQIAATLLAASLSYWLVERPVRSGALGRLVGRPALLFGPVAIVMVLGVATVVMNEREDGAPAGDSPVMSTPFVEALPPPADPALAVTRQTETAGPAEAAGPTRAAGPTEVVGSTEAAGSTEAVGPSERRRVVMIGDSVAHTLAGGWVGEFPEFAPWSPEQSPYDPTRVDLVSLARPACSYLPGEVTFRARDGSYTSASLAAFCGDWQADVDRALSAGVDDVVVVLSNDLLDRRIDDETVVFGSDEHDALLLRFLDDLRQAAAGSGARVVVVALPPREGTNAAEAHRDRRYVSFLGEFVRDRPDVAMVDLGPVVCPDGTCADWRYDGWHFSTDGAGHVADVLTERLVGTAGQG